MIKNNPRCVFIFDNVRSTELRQPFDSILLKYFWNIEFEVIEGSLLIFAKKFQLKPSINLWSLDLRYKRNRGRLDICGQCNGESWADGYLSPNSSGLLAYELQGYVKKKQYKDLIWFFILISEQYGQRNCRIQVFGRPWSPEEQGILSLKIFLDLLIIQIWSAGATKIFISS